MEVPEKTSSIISGAALPQSGEIVLAKFEALTSRADDSGSQMSEQIEEQVLGYLEVQPSEVQLVQDSNTIYLQPQEIEIDGEHLILAQGEEAGEIIVVVSTDQEHSTDQAVAELAQGAVVNATVVHSESGENKARMFVVNQSNAQFDFGGKKLFAPPSTKAEVEHLSKSSVAEQTAISSQNETRVADNASMHNAENILSAETSKPSSDNKDKELVSSKNISSQCNASSSSQELKDRKLMQLACIAHEMQIEGSQVTSQTDNNTSKTATTELSEKTHSSESEDGVSGNFSSTARDVADISTHASSDNVLQNQSSFSKIKTVVSELNVSEASNQNQSSEFEERSRRSVEAAETIAALQQSEKLPLDEVSHLSQSDQSVPNDASVLALSEKSSQTVPERQIESSLISSDSSTLSNKSNDNKNVECDKASESEVILNDAASCSTEEQLAEIRENQAEKKKSVSSDSYTDRLEEQSASCLKESHSNSVLGSDVIDVKISEVGSSEESSNMRKELFLETSKEIMLEASVKKQTDLNFPSLSQSHSFPQESSGLTKSTSSNVVQIFENYNMVTEDHPNKTEIPKDIKTDKKIGETCTAASSSSNSGTLSEIKENASLLQTVDEPKIIDETVKCVSDLNNSEINIQGLNTKERTNTKETTGAKDTFSQDITKSSSSQAVLFETVSDNSFDQVVPQLEIAGGSVEKSSEIAGMCQGTNDSWFSNKQEVFLNSDIQKITCVQDLHNREDFQQKLIRQSCLNSDIPCVQKNETFYSDSQIKSVVHPISAKTNSSERLTATQTSDKSNDILSSAAKGMTEERKKIVQTNEYAQKQPFMQSPSRPLRPKQPVVIHLRSSIAKPSTNDLSKSEVSNKPIVSDDKGEIKEKNESLSKSKLSETEENNKAELRIINDKESVKMISLIHGDVNIVDEQIAAMETNSFIEQQMLESSDHSSIESETSHSSVEIFNDQLDVKKDLAENEAEKALEERAEYLTPKIQKQFQLLISPEKSESEVSFTSIKSKIHQKLQFESDTNDSKKDTEIICDKDLLQEASNRQGIEIEINITEKLPITDKVLPITAEKLECESTICSEHESEESGDVHKTRGVKRKSLLSSRSATKVSKLDAESINTTDENKIELSEKSCLRSASKRKSAGESEKPLKQLKTGNLKKQTDGKGENSKSKMSSLVQKTWCLRSRSTPMKKVNDQDSKLDKTSPISESIQVQLPVVDENSAKASIEDSTNNLDVQNIHPASDKCESVLSSVPALESLAEDSDHSGVSEDHASRPPVLITRNKFLNSNNPLSPKNKRQYIKKHVKSKSVPLSVQKAQSPRKYSPKAAKSQSLPSTVTPVKKHVRTMSEQMLPLNSEDEENAITPIKVCDFRIRCQTPVTPTEKVDSYSCVGCCFRTSRVQNLIHHYREKCLYTGPDAFHWDIDQIEGAKREDSQKNFKANGCSTTKHIIDAGKNIVGSTTNIPTRKLHIRSCDKLEESADSDSNSDDLPPAFDTPSKKKFGFAEDDVVWVEWKTVHWPALVRKIYMKQRKASIMFIDSPSAKKGIRVSVKKISTFDNAERNKKYLSEGRVVSSHSDTLVKAVQKAEDFLRKRCLGINISAAQFFGNLDDFPEYISDKESCSGTPSESSDITRERHLSEVSSTRSFSPVLRTSEESVKQNDIDIPDKDEASNLETLARRKEKRKHQNAKLLQCIKDGKVEAHLLGVYRNTITSERHKLFHSNVASERNQLKHVSWFGPIDDEEQQEEIYDYCLQLFKSACQYKTFETFDLVAYMFEVWVPEGVVRAISRVRRMSMSQAEEVFAKGVQWSKAEKEEARKEFASFPFTEEDRREHREKMADSLRIAGVEENIIQTLDL